MLERAFVYSKLVLISCVLLPLSAQEGAPTKSETATEKVADSLIEKFQNGLSNTKFIGQFTVTGMEGQAPKQEEYTITKVKKLEKGDWWEIVARIKYGDHDLTVPIRMEVKWADKTPVITIDRLFIPGLGTFDARVLLRKDKYAGTWAHDEVGGHLFGKIEKLDESGQSEESQKVGDGSKKR